MHAAVKLIIFIIIVHMVPLGCAESVFIVIHGTWGSESNWYMPGGDFFDALERTVCVKNSAVVPFYWSGGCGHASRVKAAYNLAKLIATYDKNIAIYLVAHSHGGNIATLACQILSSDTQQNKNRIRAVFTLGTPVMENYLPNMDVIMYLYNLFSLEDFVQPVFGISQRVYPVHRRIANMRVFINGKEPGHAALHDPIIAQWLPLIHQQFKQYLRQRDIFNKIAEPSIIYFDHTKAPEYACDIKRDVLINRDYQLSVLILASSPCSVRLHTRAPNQENEKC